MESELYGCKHYKRKCEIEAPCCKKFYICRLCREKGPGCHVETLDRYSISKIKCLLCKTEQAPSQICTQCQTTFASYYCDICHLFDDSGKSIYHCDQCKICRKGKKEDIIHCNTCNACFSKDFAHECRENVLNQNCSICMENLFYTRNSLTQLQKCGHWIHLHCLNNYLKSGGINCPICSTSIGKEDEEDIQYLDKLIEETKSNIPTEFQKNVTILCNNCQKTSTDVPFHPYGMKCKNCGSYNTKE